MKGIIAMPLGGRYVMPHKTAQCLVNLVHQMKRVFGEETEITYSEISVFEHARNKLIQGCDWLLMIDSDMTFTAEDGVDLVQTLIEKKLDMVSGLYFMGYDPYYPCIYDTKAKDVYTNYPKDSLFEIAYCGLGFCAISGKTIAALPSNPFWMMEKQGQWLEPDLSFCTRVRDKGLKIWCDSKIQLGHLRMYEITKDWVENKKPEWLENRKTSL